jgi:hypothetical protein
VRDRRRFTSFFISSILSSEVAEALLRRHFIHNNLSLLLPPLPARPERDDYRAAFTVRDHLVRSFLGEKPFLRWPTDPEDLEDRQDVERICQ